MAIINPGEAIFENVRGEFASPFPSNDSLASKRFQALITANNNSNPKAGDFARWGMETFISALQFTEKARATEVGDLLTSQLNEIAKIKKGVGGEYVWGLFANVSLPSSTDPAVITRKLVDAGFAVGMTILAAQPVYGTIAAAVVSAGYKLAKIFDKWATTRNPPATLPWTEYSGDRDSDIVNHFLDNVAGTVDWTPLFSPPFDDEPWQFARRSNAEKIDGVIFAPVRNGQVAWRQGSLAYGCIPNTARVLGVAQTTLTPIPHPAVLDRLLDGQGKQTPPIPYRIETTQTGDYEMALGQLGLAVWQQIWKVGPEMYRIDVDQLTLRWKNCSDNLFETGFDSLASIPSQLKVPFPAMFLETFGSQLLEEYVAVRRTPMPWDPGWDPELLGSNNPNRRFWRLGLFPNSPRPNPIVHRDIFKVGPVKPANRSIAAWFEQDLKRKGWGWPYGTLPKQDRARLASADGFLTPGSLKPSGLDASNPSKGYRAVPWPFPELREAEFAPINQAFCAGTLAVLGGWQTFGLQRIFDADVAQGYVNDRVLLPAYIRPDAVKAKNGGALPMYAAFNNKKLQQVCRDARAKLLELVAKGHPAGRALNLDDASAVDPAFSDQLRSAITKAPKWPLDKLAPDKLAKAPPKGKVPDESPPPADPQGGIPFAGEMDFNPPTKSGKGGLGFILGLAALGLAAKARR